MTFTPVIAELIIIVGVSTALIIIAKAIKGAIGK